MHQNDRIVVVTMLCRARDEIVSHPSLSALGTVQIGGNERHGLGFFALSLQL